MIHLGISHLTYSLFRPGIPLTQEQQHFVTRKPVPLSPFFSSLRPFPLSIWLLVIFTFGCFCVTFWISYKVYHSHYLAHANLARKENNPVMFVIKTLVGAVEPENVPWFKDGWSGGKLASFFWTLFSFIIIMFYCCNLRTVMTVVTYEVPVDTLSGILESGKNIYMAQEFYGYRFVTDKGNCKAQ